MKYYITQSLVIGRWKAEPLYLCDFAPTWSGDRRHALQLSDSEAQQIVAGFPRPTNPKPKRRRWFWQKPEPEVFEQKYVYGAESTLDRLIKAVQKAFPDTNIKVYELWLSDETKCVFTRQGKFATVLFRHGEFFCDGVTGERDIANHVCNVLAG